MDVILLQRVTKLGQIGDVVNVRPGYARNYLLPQRKAMRATDENRKRIEAEKSQLEAINLERKVDAERVADSMTGFSVVLIRQAGESGQLYGSVNARDIAEAARENGVTLNRNQIELARPIKTLGIYTVAAALHPEVIVDITVNVARSLEQAEMQAETGRAALRSDADDAIDGMASESFGGRDAGTDEAWEPVVSVEDQPRLDAESIEVADDGAIRPE